MSNPKFGKPCDCGKELGRNNGMCGNQCFLTDAQFEDYKNLCRVPGCCARNGHGGGHTMGTWYDPDSYTNTKEEDDALITWLKNGCKRSEIPIIPIPL